MTDFLSGEYYLARATDQHLAFAAFHTSKPQSRSNYHLHICTYISRFSQGNFESDSSPVNLPRQRCHSHSVCRNLILQSPPRLVSPPAEVVLVTLPARLLHRPFLPQVPSYTRPPHPHSRPDRASPTNTSPDEVGPAISMQLAKSAQCSSSTRSSRGKGAAQNMLLYTMSVEVEPEISCMRRTQPGEKVMLVVGLPSAGTVRGRAGTRPGDETDHRMSSLSVVLRICWVTFGFGKV